MSQAGNKAGTKAGSERRERREKILLLQGPMGPFFDRLRRELQDLGHEVHRLLFNAGDLFFDPLVALSKYGHIYRGSRDEFAAYFRSLLERERFDAIALFGDGRPLHRIAVNEARTLGVAIYVFEEGYFRPHWITIERDGVNGYSKLPREAEAYLEAGLSEPPEPMPVLPSFSRGALYSTFYVIAMRLGWPFFPRYIHHRPLTMSGETFYWIRSAVRKRIYRYQERGIEDELAEARHKRFFLVPLQVHCDYQLKHSDYESIEEFIIEVLEGFARVAPPDQSIAFKHHPMDRPYTNYRRFIEREAKRLGLEGRVFYLHDQDLQRLIDASLGVIVINSTVGLEAIGRGAPTLALGRAIYRIKGLSFDGSLEDFLRAPLAPDAALYEAFRRVVMADSQSNGSFMRPLADMDTPTGIRFHQRAPFGLGRGHQ